MLPPHERSLYRADGRDVTARVIMRVCPSVFRLRYSDGSGEKNRVKTKNTLRNVPDNSLLVVTRSISSARGRWSATEGWPLGVPPFFDFSASTDNRGILLYSHLLFFLPFPLSLYQTRRYQCFETRRVIVSLRPAAAAHWWRVEGDRWARGW